MSAYLWIMLAGSVAVFALYGLRCAGAVRLPVLRKNAYLTALLRKAGEASAESMRTFCGKQEKLLRNAGHGANGFF